MAKLRYEAPYHPLVTPRPTLPRLPGAANANRVRGSLKSVAPYTAPSSAGIRLQSFSLPSFTPPSFKLPTFDLPFGRASTQNAIKTGTMPNNPLKRFLGGK